MGCIKQSVKGTTMTEIEKLKKENETLKKVLRHVFPEISDYYFICGEGGKKDFHGLPERIVVCPKYGSEVIVTYRRDK